MAAEIVIGYVRSQSNITADVLTPAGVLRIADIPCPESFSGSGVYIGDFPTITPGDTIQAYHSGVFLGSTVYEDKAALVTTILDPDPAGGTTTDAIFDMVAGSSDDDEYLNMIVTIVDISGGVTVTRRVIAYDGTNKRITLDFPAEFPLDVADKVTIWANAYDSYSGPSVVEITSGVWDAQKSDHRVSGSMGLAQGIHGWQGK